MARIARVVAPGEPHHVTQRGNRRQKVFFREEDYRFYRDLVANACKEYGVAVWAYCLMPNHVHLVLVPESEDGLARAIGETHRRYARYVNLRKQWSGHLWQGRFSSVVMDQNFARHAVRYVEQNPVRAGLVRLPGEYAWSSAPAHLSGKDDALVQVQPLLDEVGDWAAYLGREVAEPVLEGIRRHERTGRPLGSAEFLTVLQDKLGRDLTPRKRGPRGPRKLQLR